MAPAEALAVTRAPRAAPQTMPFCAPPTNRTAETVLVQIGGYLRCAQVMVNYTALEEASPAAVSRCACASIAYGVRWYLGYEIPTYAQLMLALTRINS
jgi:hypothetical protein